MAKRRGGFPQMGGNMNHLMAQAQKMQKQIEQAQAEAAEMTGAGTAGGGMVAVEVNGQHQLTKIELKPEVVDPEDIEMLQDLIVAAVNEAVRDLDEKVEKHMAAVPGVGGLGGMMGF